jgi:hypothetical protein
MKRDLGNRRIKTFVLFVAFAAVFFAGCFNPTEPDKPAVEPKTLVVYIAGETPAERTEERTALPSAPVSAKYTISVTSGATSLGSANFTSTGPYLIELSEAPDVGDVVKVESFNSSNVKYAEGTYILASANVGATPSPVSVTVRPVMEGNGIVNLNVSFNRFKTNNDEITLAEVKLYQNLAVYKAYREGGPPNTDLASYRSQYQVDGSYGTGTIFTGNISTPDVIPLNYSSLVSGNYVLMIEFFRGTAVNKVKVSRLVQTIIVRGGLTTDKWVESVDNTLTWDAFASSNAKLADTIGIQISGTTFSFSPATTTYDIYEATIAIPTTKTLTLTRGEPGQTFEVALNGGAAVSLVSGTPYSFAALKTAGSGDPALKNTLVITVTAPDGITEKTYTVNISGKEIIDFYFEVNSLKYGVGAGVVSGSGSGGGMTSTITATVPYGTNLAALVPTVNHSGVSISPVAGTAWGSAASPHTYTVTAIDTTTANYTVTVAPAKIASVTAVNGTTFLSPGFIKTGSDISAAITSAITSVVGADSLGTVINLAAGDYSVDALTPTTAGGNVSATLRVPALKTSTGSDVTKSFDVYIKNDAKEITSFSITSPVSATGIITGTTIAVSVPYGTSLTSMAASATLSPNASISPDPTTARSYASPVTYAVTAEDGSNNNYTVTVQEQPGLTIAASIETLGTFTFASSTATVSLGGSAITITPTPALASNVDWHYYISGPVTSNSTSSGTTGSFAVPTKRGFYNVNVFAIIDTIPYSGSFGLIVE